jgi:hypothetical protein
MIEMYGYPYVAIKNEMYYGSQKDFTIPNDIYSIAKDGNNKWVMYASSGRTYVIQGYDQMNQPLGSSVMGGILPENQMYSCVLGDDLYISSSVNKKMVLPNRSQNRQNPDWWDQWNKEDRLVKDHSFAPVSNEMIQIENKVESIVLEPKPAEKKVSLVYAWTTICLILFAILASMLNGETPSFLYVLLVLSGIALFLITAIL